MPNDPKWRTISRVSGATISEVIAVYLHILVEASNADERGRTQPNIEDIASALDITTERVQSIVDAMQGRVIDGDRLTGWEKRQPKREDNSADRAKRWREEQKRTQENASERKRPLEKRREEERREEIKTTTTPSAEEFLAAWNENRGRLPEAKTLTASRKKKLAVRVKEGLTAESFTSAVKIAARTPFCRGENDRGWRLDFDFLVENDTNLTRVLEGKYGLPDPEIRVQEMSIIEALGDFLPPEFREPAGAA
jgi:hypothetical protein